MHNLLLAQANSHYTDGLSNLRSGRSATLERFELINLIDKARHLGDASLEHHATRLVDHLFQLQGVLNGGY